MYSRRVLGFAVPPFVLLAAFVLAGCTVAGAIIGDHSDAKARWTKGKRTPVPALRLVGLEKGKAVEVAMRDGSLVQGSYQGLEPVAESLYARRWQEALQQLADEVTLPPLGPGVRVRTRSGRETNCTLLGIGPGYLSVREDGSRAPARVPLGDVAGIGIGEGALVEGETLARLVAEGRVPLLEAIVVRERSGPRAVPLEDVRTVSLVARGHKGTMIGALVGAAIDVAVLAILASTWEMNWEPTCRAGDPYCTSCPLVYSHDGRSLVLDAEPLGASLFATDESSDRVLLDRIAPTDGAYRIRIRNEQREIDHLDSVRLLAVDHRPGSEVLPAMDGGVHVLGKTVPPFRAVDGRGDNLAPLLGSEDGRAWVGIPLGRDPGDPDASRETALLEFVRPAGAQAATLAFSVQATPWGGALFAHVLSLHGRDIEPFWALMENDAAARQALRSAWAREALPQVSVWTGHEWRLAGVLAHIPLALPDRRALRVDLTGIEGPTLRVRVDALPGLWAFDRIEADFSSHSPLAVTALALRVARTMEGVDARDRLARSDDERLTLAPMADGVDLVFDAPPTPPGTARSVLLELEGYYRPLLPAEGEPQTALFERLVREPGALRHYALAGVEAETRLALQRTASMR